MANERFFDVQAPLSASEAIKIAGASLVTGTPKPIASAHSPTHEDLSDAVVYVADKKALAALADKKAALCLTTEAFVKDIRSGAVAVTNAPKFGFGLIAEKLYRERRPPADLSGVSPEATVAPSAEIHASAIIAQGSEIGAGASIGAFSIIWPGVVIGAGTEVGAYAEISHSIVGAGCRIGAGAKIGGPGFGFAQTARGLARMPQLGSVEIGDHVEIGANSSADRGALDNTMIGDRTKIDNLVHIGHNVVIGGDCVVAAMTGIAGSVRIGDGVLIGGHVGIADHMTIGDRAQIAGKAGVMRHIPAGEIWGGYPAQPMNMFLRGAAMLAKSARKKTPKETDGQKNEH